MSEVNDRSIIKSVDGKWLVDGCLKACILKLFCPSDENYSEDQSRQSNVKMIRRLLNGEDALLKKELSGDPALVVAPELAFGSPDFNDIDSAVKNYEDKLVLVCGVGFSPGESLMSLAKMKGVVGVWDSDLSEGKKYNGLWVWVNDGNSVKCYICLKNKSEQHAEVAIPNIKMGNSILRLETDDLVIFPLVCADVISAKEGCPREKILTSLRNTDPGRKKIVITGSLLNVKSESDYWKTAIGDTLNNLRDYSCRMLLSNCINVRPVLDEDKDKWRCLSGVYQPREGAREPVESLPNIRFVKAEKFSGFVLRNSVESASFGELSWTNNAAENLHAYSSCNQFIWDGEGYVDHDACCWGDELYRFVVRNKENLLHHKLNLSGEGKDRAEKEVQEFMKSLSPKGKGIVRAGAKSILNKVINGIDKEGLVPPDSLHEIQSELTTAVTLLVLTKYVMDGQYLDVEPEARRESVGQIKADNVGREILVWNNEKFQSRQMYEKVKGEVVVEGGSARPLTILARGNNLGTIPDEGRIKSDRLSDISSSSSRGGETENDIRDPRNRVVYWKNQSTIDDVLMNADSEATLADRLAKEILVGGA